MTTFAILLPARYGTVATQDIIKSLGVRGLEQSPAYVEMFDRGRVEGREAGRVEGRADAARAMILRMGTARFGKPTKRTVAKLDAVTDPAALEDLGVRLLTVANWKELFAPPSV